MLRIRQKIYFIFFILLMASEFYYIRVGSGYVRLYHFLAPLIVLSLARFIPRLFLSSVFLAILSFGAINLVAAILSDIPTNALSSLGLLYANIMIAIATALILISGKVSLNAFKKIILFITISSVLWGIVQVIVFKFFGVSVGFSEAQDIQISTGFAPGFRTEANTFAKYLNFAFLLLLPSIIRERCLNKSLFVVLVLIVGICLSFTRSAIYGLAVTLVIIFICYLLRRNAVMISRRIVVLFGFIAISLPVFINSVGNFNEYSVHKINHFFDKKEIFSGGSSSFRLMSQNVLIDSFLHNDKSVLIGNGWGQVKFYYGGDLWQAGGGELLTVLAYGGLFAVAAYFVYFFSSFRSAMKMVRFEPNRENQNVYEGIMFAIVGLFVTGQINGSLNAPEYWMLLGVGIYLSIKLHSIHFRQYKS